MRPVLLCKTVLLLSLYAALDFNAEAACSKLGEICQEDCDCCDTETKPGIKCESRGTGDRKCYLSNKIGDQCTENSDCKSQWCSGGICVPKFTHRPRSDPKMMSYCNMDLSVLEVINGYLPNGKGTCACTNPSMETKSSAQNLMSTPYTYPGTTYSNNYALGSGFVIRPLLSGPVRFMKICTANGDSNRDPTSYKIQRKCAETGSLKTIQEGALSFPMREKNPAMTDRECTLVTITEKKSFYLEYHITFPTQRFGDPACSPNASCIDYPTSISELSLLGHCTQVAEAQTLAPTPAPTRAPTRAPTNKISFNGKIKVKCIYNPCDKDGSWDESDVYVKVYSNGSYIGKTSRKNDIKEDRSYCYNTYFYPGAVNVGSGYSWRVEFKVYDYDSSTGDDYMGSISYTMTSARTYNGGLGTGCKNTRLTYEVKAY